MYVDATNRTVKVLREANLDASYQHMSFSSSFVSSEEASNCKCCSRRKYPIPHLGGRIREGEEVAGFTAGIHARKGIRQKDDGVSLSSLP